MSVKVKKVFKENALIAVYILSLVSSAFASCSLGLSKDTTLRPKLLSKIGSHKVEFIINKEDTTVSIFENQELEAHCNTGFENPTGLSTENILKVKCEDNHLRFELDLEYCCPNLLVCSSQKWNLYESSQNFVWCSSNITSYLLARPLDSRGTNLQYLAAVCYDIPNLSFKSLYYTLAPTREDQKSPSVLGDFYTPSLELKYLKETFGIKRITESDYDSQDIRDWVKYAQYNYSSVIQNTLLLNEFNDQLGSLLDLPWWPNLRLGNWKRYEMALTKQVESEQHSYDILAGVSAVATVPIIENCQTNYTLKELLDNGNNKIPMYVWNYLHSTSNSSDEIVIIGLNSPFYEFYSEDDIVFCQDICEEIPWLKKASTTFRYSALGIIFCCNTEDVIQSKVLDGFPEININSKPRRAINFY